MQGEDWELASGRKPCEASGVQGSAKLTQFVAKKVTEVTFFSYTKSLAKPFFNKASDITPQQTSQC